MAKTAVKKKTTKPSRKAGGVNKSAAVRDYAKANPGKTAQEIADALGYAYTTVYQALNSGKKKKAGRKKVAKRAKATNAAAPTNGNGASEFIHSAFALGLDRAIGMLQRVKDAIG